MYLGREDQLGLKDEGLFNFAFFLIHWSSVKPSDL